MHLLLFKMMFDFISPLPLQDSAQLSSSGYYTTKGSDMPVFLLALLDYPFLATCWPWGNLDMIQTSNG